MVDDERAEEESMKARRNSVCPNCKGGIFAGDDIASTEKGYGHEKCPAAVQKPLFHPDQDRVVAWLQAKDEANEMSSFLRSVLEQYKKVGSLSDRQIEVIIPKLAAGRPPREINGLPTAEVVPAARYAVESNGGVLVIRVWRGTRNPRVVKVYDDDRGLEMSARGAAGALKAIVEQDPIECAKRYGQLRRKCARCDLPLKNKLSVELAMGPTCLKHFHSPERCNTLRALARDAIRTRGEDPNEVASDVQHDALVNMEVMA
jgi:hypothetical protein